VPTFNLVANIWRWSTPVTDAPDVLAFCQLKAGMKGYGTGVVEAAQRTGTTSYATSTIPRLLLFPKGTDVRRIYWAGSVSNSADTIEAPAGSGMFWYCADVWDVAFGFRNEFRVAMVWQIRALPFPTPYPSGPPFP
jgi:hypothetical protein